MSTLATQELWSIFDARRVKAPELKGLDAAVNGVRGWFTTRKPVLSALKAQAARIEKLEPEVQTLGSTAFKEAVAEVRDLARVKRLTGPAEDKAMALVREGARRAVGLRPYPVQSMGALAMTRGHSAEMATGEGKAPTAALAACFWGWCGRPVHIITVNDYLVQRDSEEMAPIYHELGLTVGHVIHESAPTERIDHYRRSVVYCTSKELVADFLRDQIMLGNLRNSTQTTVGMLMGQGAGRVMVPGLFRVIVDEADSLLIDEAVTPLIISNSPQEEGNAALHRAAYDLCDALEVGRDFTIDKTVKSVDLTARGQHRLELLSDGSGFWKGKRRR